VGHNHPGAANGGASDPQGETGETPSDRDAAVTVRMVTFLCALKQAQHLGVVLPERDRGPCRQRARSGRPDRSPEHDEGSEGGNADEPDEPPGNGSVPVIARMCGIRLEAWWITLQRGCVVGIWPN